MKNMKNFKRCGWPSCQIGFILNGNGILLVSGAYKKTTPVYSLVCVVRNTPAFIVGNPSYTQARLAKIAFRHSKPLPELKSLELTNTSDNIASSVLSGAARRDCKEPEVARG